MNSSFLSQVVAPRHFRVLLALAVAACTPLYGQEEEATTSLGKQYEGIVRVDCASINPDYRTPWNPGLPSGGSGTAFLIGPNLFMTNAHVVSNGNRITLKKVGDAVPLPAKVKHIAHDCDLAVLELEDPEAFKDVPPLGIASDIPKLDTTVKVVGYPVGGERISVTRGVVSRVDFVAYSHSSADHHLAIQIDAAINPGNSGGPVLQNNGVVGVAFQGYSGDVAQNTGYMIPTPVISRFLTDIKDGKYDNYVELGSSDFTLLNKAQRKALGLQNDGIGIMVSDVSAESSSDGKVETGDVILAMDGKNVMSNGMIDIGGEQVDMAEIVERKFAGDEVTLTVLRKGQKQEVKVTLKAFKAYSMTARQYEKRPEYVTFCGLVFQPLDSELMGAHQLNTQRLRYYYRYFVTDEIYKERPQIVVLTQVLPDAINTHIREAAPGVVEEINGVKILSLKDVPTALAKDVEGSHIVVKLEGEGRPLVFEKSKIADAEKRIRGKYNVEEAAYITQEK
jgi:S1-C subfamily serine protease